MPDFPEPTPDEIREALTRAGGNFNGAAIALGVPVANIVAALRKNSSSDTVMQAAPLTIEQLALADRELTDDEAAAVLPEIQALAALVDKEDKMATSRLGRSLGSILDEDEAKLAMSLQDFYGKHIGQAVGVVGGSMVVVSMKTLGVLKKVQERIMADRYEGNSATFQRMADMNSMIGLAQSMVKINDSIHAAALARAKILQMQQQKDKVQNRDRKAGWAPKTVDVSSTTKT